MDTGIISITAGIFTILGVIIGGIIGRRSEHNQWLRNQQVKSYEEFLEVSGSFRLTAYFALINSEVDFLKRVEIVERYFDAATAISLYGTVEIHATAQLQADRSANLLAWLGDLKSLENPEGLDGESKKQTITRLLHEKMDQFVSEGQKRNAEILNLMRVEIRAPAFKRGFLGIRWKTRSQLESQNFDRSK